MNQQHFLITGGAGFIGSHLVDALLAAGHRVTVLDDLSVGKEQNFAHHRTDPNFRFVRGSILDAPLMDSLASQVDAIYHLAAVVGVTYVVRDPLHGMMVNLRGTEIVLQAAAKHRRRVLIASSSEAYGKSTHVPFREDDDTLMGPTSVPRWAYALAKLLDEHFAFAYYRQTDLPTVAVRYFNAYGPRLDPRGYGSVVARFITQALTGQPLTVYGDGEQTRSFTFVKETVQGTIAAMDTPAATGHVFNIGNAHETTINELATTIRDLAGASVEIVHVPYEQAYGKHFEETHRRQPDISRAADVLGFRATVSLRDGLQKTISWFKEHRNELIAS